MDQLSIKERILSSISYAQKELGYTLVREGFGDSISKCACALSCVLLADNPGNILDPGRILYSSAKILGVDPTWTVSFMDGFDGKNYHTKYDEAWKLGERICAETNPPTHDEYVRKLDLNHAK